MMSSTNFETRALIPKMPKTEALIPYLQQIDENRWYSNFGPLNEQLTERFAKYFSVQSNMVCTISNATLGLQAVLTNINVDKSASVEVPSFTFSASVAAILSSMRNVSFIDIDNQMRCIPSEGAKLIMDVLPFGAAPRFPEWYRDADFVVVDGAASFDALKDVGLQKSMKENIAIVVSLHSTKLIGGGEGGIIISKNIELIQMIKKWQNFGFDIENTKNRSSTFAGTNAKMSEYSCAVTLASLDNWDVTRSDYLNIALQAKQICASINLNVHQAMTEDYATPNWIIISERKRQLEEIKKAFESLGFETKKWWQEGCHKMSAYSSFIKKPLTNTDSISERYLGLPFHLFLQNKYWYFAKKILSEIEF